MLNYIYRQKAYMGKKRMAMRIMVIIAIFLLPSSVFAQLKMSMDSYLLYEKAVTNQNDSAKFFLYVDSLVMESKRKGEKIGEIIASSLLMNYYGERADKYFTEFRKYCKKTRDKSKEYGHKELYWLGWCTECNILINRKLFKEGYQMLKEIEEEAKGDELGTTFLYTLYVDFYKMRGAKRLTEENLIKLEALNSKIKNNLPIAAGYDFLNTLEKDPWKRLHNYEKAIANCQKEDSLHNLINIAVSSAECIDKDLFESNMEKYRVFVDNHRILPSDWTNAHNYICEMYAYKAAFEGDSLKAFTYIDSLKYEKRRVKECSYVILGKYDKACEIARKTRQEAYKKYASFVEYDARTLATFIENDRLRRKRAEQELALVNLRTQQLALESEHERMMADSLDASTKLLKIKIQDAKTKEAIRQKERDLEQEEIAIEIAKQEEMHLASASRKRIMSMAIFMLSITTLLTGMYYRIQTKDSRDLKLLEDIMLQNTNTAA